VPLTACGGIEGGDSIEIQWRLEKIGWRLPALPPDFPVYRFPNFLVSVFLVSWPTCFLVYFLLFIFYLRESAFSVFSAFFFLLSFHFAA